VLSFHLIFFESGAGIQTFTIPVIYGVGMMNAIKCAGNIHSSGLAQRA
jgi:hypothetical protein